MNLALVSAIALSFLLAGCASAQPESAGASSAASESPSPAEREVLSAETLHGLDLDYAQGQLTDKGVAYTVWNEGGTRLDGNPQEPLAGDAWFVIGTEPAGLDPGPGDEVKVIVRQRTSEPSPAPSESATTPVGRKITYVVTADGPILVTTFGNTIGGRLSTEQANDVRSPFKKEYFFTESELSGGFNHLSVTAQAGEGTTKISCQILSDGTEMTKNTSTGPYAIVMCTG